MRVLVLGGGGFVGFPIVCRLLARGHSVCIFGRRPGLTLPGGLPFIQGDRNRLEQYRAQFEAFRPESVVDAIAFTKEQAESLVHAFREVTDRIAVLSSGDVYRAYDVFFGHAGGSVDAVPLTETAPLRSRLYPYRGTLLEGFDTDNYEKILVERAVLPIATVLRLPMVYGPWDVDGKKRRFWGWQKLMFDGAGTIVMDQRTARWRGPWGYSGDVGEAASLAIEHDRARGQIFNVGEQDGLDMEGRVRELAEVVGWKGQLEVVDEPCPPPNFPRSFHLQQHLWMDTSKIRRELGYGEMVPRREALRQTSKWDAEHPVC